MSNEDTKKLEKYHKILKLEQFYLLTSDYVDDYCREYDIDIVEDYEIDRIKDSEVREYERNRNNYLKLIDEVEVIIEELKNDYKND